MQVKFKKGINDFKYLAKEKEVTFNDSNNINIIADRNSIKELVIIFLDNDIDASGATSLKLKYSSEG